MQMTNKELDRLKSVLEDLENEVFYVYKNISGGFARAEMFDYDDNYIDVELRHGVQSDCENRINTEQYKVDRRTFEIK